MRVASVEAIPVSYPEPNDFNALRHLCLVKLVADDGQVGWVNRSRSSPRRPGRPRRSSRGSRP